jgi:hypothetical protein
MERRFQTRLERPTRWDSTPAALASAARASGLRASCSAVRMWLWGRECVMVVGLFWAGRERLLKGWGAHHPHELRSSSPGMVSFCTQYRSLVKSVHTTPL